MVDREKEKDLCTRKYLLDNPVKFYHDRLSHSEDKDRNISRPRRLVPIRIWRKRGIPLRIYFPIVRYIIYLFISLFSYTVFKKIRAMYFYEQALLFLPTGPIISLFCS